MHLTIFVVLALLSMTASMALAFSFRRALLVHVLPPLIANIIGVGLTVQGYIQDGEHLAAFDAGAFWCICIVPYNALIMLLVPLIITHEKRKEFHTYIACIAVFASLVVFGSWCAVLM